jgi:RNA polymerase sigma-54 factor
MILAPQLRQSLEMLQVPILELRAMIQKELEQNPTIEEAAKDLGVTQLETEEPAIDDRRELDFDKEFEALAKLDDEWRDYFFQNQQANPYSEGDAEKRQFMLDSLPQQQSLQDHLVEQLNLTTLSDTDRQIGEMLIGSITEDGYLAASMEELAVTAHYTPHQIEDVLAVIHDFHPVGVGARDLRECLLLQIERLGHAETLAADIVRNHLDKIGERNLLDVARALNTSIEAVQDAAKVIATLNPKPGRLFTSDVAEYVVPEVAVEKVDGQYVVILNNDHLPHIRISRHYRDLMEDPSTTREVKEYVRDKIRSGAFLIKSIHQRQATIHKVATEIVTRQTPFLDNGISQLVPMTMSDVARSVGVHETTVSRTVSGKYIRTPSGIFEMKFFFTPGIKTDAGGELSNKTVKDMIDLLVDSEDSSKPYSDQEILEHLKAKGIQIARRTITKYRLMLGIKPSHERRI